MQELLRDVMFTHTQNQHKQTEAAFGFFTSQLLFLVSKQQHEKWKYNKKVKWNYYQWENRELIGSVCIEAVLKPQEQMDCIVQDVHREVVELWQVVK